MLVDEFVVGGCSVLADAQNSDVVGFELLPAIAEVAGFFGAARGVVLGIEVQNNLLPAQRSEAEGITVLIGKGEVGGGVADLQTHGKAFSVEAAYGPQDKTVRAAYVAINLQLLGHGAADPGRANCTLPGGSGPIGHGLERTGCAASGSLVGSRCSSDVAGESQPEADAARNHPASTQRSRNPF